MWLSTIATSSGISSSILLRPWVAVELNGVDGFRGIAANIFQILVSTVSLKLFKLHRKNLEKNYGSKLLSSRKQQITGL
jgi:hypothetical protein